jgi:hypothetical protein
MMLLFLTGFTLGDKMPLLNPYELVRHSGVAFLPESGTRYIADVEKLGSYALLVGWVAWIVVSIILANVLSRLYQLIR